MTCSVCFLVALCNFKTVSGGVWGCSEEMIQGGNGKAGSCRLGEKLRDFWHCGPSLMEGPVSCRLQCYLLSNSLGSVKICFQSLDVVDADCPQKTLKHIRLSLLSFDCLLTVHTINLQTDAKRLSELLTRGNTWVCSCSHVAVHQLWFTCPVPQLTAWPQAHGKHWKQCCIYHSLFTASLLLLQ